MRSSTTSRVLRQAVESIGELRRPTLHVVECTDCNRVERSRLGEHPQPFARSGGYCPVTCRVRQHVARNPEQPRPGLAVTGLAKAAAAQPTRRERLRREIERAVMIHTPSNEVAVNRHRIDCDLCGRSPASGRQLQSSAWRAIIDGSLPPSNHATVQATTGNPRTTMSRLTIGTGDSLPRSSE